MFTNLRINYITESAASEIISQFNILIPDFCHKKEPNRHGSYVFLLSDKHNWTENHNDILRILKILSPVLSYAEKQNASLEVDPGIFLSYYSLTKNLEIEFSPELIHIFSQHGIHSGLSIYAAEFKLDEEAALISKQMENEGKTPMNCFLHIYNADKFDFLFLKEKINKVLPELAENISYNQNENIFSVLFASKADWDENRDEIMNKINLLSLLFSDMRNKKIRLEIVVHIDMQKYRNRNLTCFIFTNKFAYVLAQHDMKLKVIIIPE